MSQLGLAWRLARRELRGGLKGFGVLLACLCLGVAVIAGVGSLGASIDAGLNGDARALLGGDIEFNLAQRQAGDAERAFLAAQGTLERVTRMRAMAIADNGASRSLIELKAIDNAYPLYGSIALAPPRSRSRQRQWPSATVPGAQVVAPAMLDRLGL